MQTVGARYRLWVTRCKRRILDEHGIDTNKRPEVLPTIGCRWARGKKDASCHLGTPYTFYIDGITLLKRAPLVPQLGL
jgi:hypothetical protein